MSLPLPDCFSHTHMAAPLPPGPVQSGRGLPKLQGGNCLPLPLLALLFLLFPAPLSFHTLFCATPKLLDVLLISCVLILFLALSQLDIWHRSRWSALFLLVGSQGRRHALLTHKIQVPRVILCTNDWLP